MAVLGVRNLRRGGAEFGWQFPSATASAAPAVKY